MKALKAILLVLAVIVGVVVLLFAGASFYAWLFMLAAGALGKTEWGFWTCFPAGALLAFISGSKGNSTYRS